MDVSDSLQQNKLVDERIDLSDHVLVVGTGLIGLDAALILSKAGIKTSIISSTSRLNDGAQVFVNGRLDSTFMDSQGIGGMAKFWAGQMMRMEKRHFLDRPNLGFLKFIEFDSYYQASKLVEKDYGLSDFGSLHLPIKRRFLARKLPYFENVFSQFVETNIYSKLMNQMNKTEVVQLPHMRVMYFENVEVGRVEVTCKNHSGESIVVICKELLLAAGTVGNTEIVLRSREHFPSKFFDSSPIGQYLVDHPIIDLGCFEVRGSRLVNFKINQELRKGGLRIKTKFMPKLLEEEAQLFSDVLIEIAPRITATSEGNSKFLRKINTALNMFFTNFGIDLRLNRRLIDVTLHLEQIAVKENCIQLDINSENVHIHNQLTVLDHETIQKYRLMIEEALISFGYIRYTEPAQIYAEAYHYSGSLRMGVDPYQSVVNLNCEIHGNGSVKVLGLSNFPTTGFTNPTFSALALNRILLL